MNITFRPHHFLCALCFKGKGYSPSFIRNFKAIMQILQGAAGDTTLIQIVNESDSICAPCPNRQGTACQTEEKIRVLDTAHAAQLHWQPGNSITWGAAKEQIATQLTLEKFHRMCASCDWKAYGLCESVLKEFLPESS